MAVIALCDTENKSYYYYFFILYTILSICLFVMNVHIFSVRTYVFLLFVTYTSYA